MIIDYQTHWHPTVALRSRLFPNVSREGDRIEFRGSDSSVVQTSAALFDIDHHLASLDDNGVAAMVSSPVFFAGFGGMDVAQARDAAALLNEENARMQTTHPTRFVGLAVVPMHHPGLAAEVLQQAAALGLRGVCVLSNYEGASPTSDEHHDLYRLMGSLGMTCVLHPAQTSMATVSTTHDTVERGLNWMHDTSYTALSLITSGILDECPTLSVLHPHLGGVIPFISARIDGLSSRDILATLRERFYVDSASKTDPALRLALDFYGPDRVVFASDDPWGPRPRALAYVRSNLSPDEAGRLLTNRVPGLDPAAG